MSPPPDEFTLEERSILLKLAHASIESALENREIALDPPSPHLAEPRAAFTTIYFRGQLHGCVGFVLPVASLYRTVAETARAAAFEDTRFLPVTRDEAPELEVSLSILSALQPIRRRRSRNRPPRPAHQPARTPRSAASSSPRRTWLGPRNVSRTDLPQSRPAARCLAARRNHRSLHRRSLRGPLIVGRGRPRPCKLR